MQSNFSKVVRDNLTALVNEHHRNHSQTPGIHNIPFLPPSPPPLPRLCPILTSSPSQGTWHQPVKSSTDNMCSQVMKSNEQEEPVSHPNIVVVFVICKTGAHKFQSFNLFNPGRDSAHNPHRKRSFSSNLLRVEANI